jgi:hypothetical protein
MEDPQQAQPQNSRLKNHFAYGGNLQISRLISWQKFILGIDPTEPNPEKLFIKNI